MLAATTSGRTQHWDCSRVDKFTHLADTWEISLAPCQSKAGGVDSSPKATFLLRSLLLWPSTRRVRRKPSSSCRLGVGQEKWAGGFCHRFGLSCVELRTNRDVARANKLVTDIFALFGQLMVSAPVLGQGAMALMRMPRLERGDLPRRLPHLLAWPGCAGPRRRPGGRGAEGAMVRWFWWMKSRSLIVASPR